MAWASGSRRALRRRGLRSDANICVELILKRCGLCELRNISQFLCKSLCDLYAGTVEVAVSRLCNCELEL
jgi:hypothetical protein